MVWEFMKGKRTFVISALMVILGLLQGDSEMIMQGLAFIGLRLGIK